MLSTYSSSWHPLPTIPLFELHDLDACSSRGSLSSDSPRPLLVSSLSCAACESLYNIMMQARRCTSMLSDSIFCNISPSYHFETPRVDLEIRTVLVVGMLEFHGCTWPEQGASKGKATRSNNCRSAPHSTTRIKLSF